MMQVLPQLFGLDTARDTASAYTELEDPLTSLVEFSFSLNDGAETEIEPGLGVQQSSGWSKNSIDKEALQLRVEGNSLGSAPPESEASGPSPVEISNAAELTRDQSIPVNTEAKSLGVIGVAYLDETSDLTQPVVSNARSISLQKRAILDESLVGLDRADKRLINPISGDNSLQSMLQMNSEKSVFTINKAREVALEKPETASAIKLAAMGSNQEISKNEVSTLAKPSNALRQPDVYPWASRSKSEKQLVSGPVSTKSIPATTVDGAPVGAAQTRADKGQSTASTPTKVVITPPLKKSERDEYRALTEAPRSDFAELRSKASQNQVSPDPIALTKQNPFARVSQLPEASLEISYRANASERGQSKKSPDLQFASATTQISNVAQSQEVLAPSVQVHTPLQKKLQSRTTQKQATYQQHVEIEKPKNSPVSAAQNLTVVSTSSSTMPAPSPLPAFGFEAPGALEGAQTREGSFHTASESADTKKELNVPSKLDNYSRPVTQQLVQATKSLGDGTIEIKLSPEELGRVRLSLNPSETSITVHISAERPETADLIRRNIDLLSTSLKDEGFTNLEFSFSEQGHDDKGAEDRDAPLRGYDNSANARKMPVQQTGSQLLGPGQLDIRI